MAYYNGEIIYWDVVVLGLLWLMSLQLGVAYLQGYFDSRLAVASTEIDGASGVRLTPTAKLLIAYAFLAAVASFSVLLFRVVEDPAVYLLMFMITVGALCYPIPPIKLAYSGYGELVLSLLVANLTPAWGYKLQGGDSLRLLAMVTFPLTALHLAMLLVCSLSTYATDMKYTRRTMMLRMGWQNGMLVHNLLVLCAYLLLVLALTFGFSWQIGAPALLTMPVGLLLIWRINRIAAGGKPQWKSLMLMSGALFCITAYLLTFSFWIH